MDGETCFTPPILVDPARDHRYWNSLKPCESRGFALGRPLSNTWRTCPKVGDNLGKLRLRPHRPWMLECPMVESSGALGWLCDLSGRREGNGLPSLQRVRALRDVA